MNLNHINWILVAVLLVGVVIIVAVVIRFTRSVPAYTIPEDREMGEWGSVDADTARKLQSALDEAVNAQRVPGFQAFVHTPQRKTWSGASGTSDLAREQLLKPEDVFRVGSTTKTFTAVIVLRLFEEGKLSLDDSIDIWFPEIPEADTITVRHLLNHSSGIAEIIPKGMMRSMIPSTYWEKDELIQLIAKDELQFTPGSRHEYSNSNYILLGFVTEAVSGKTAVKLLHEEIIDPLKLEHTYFIPYEPSPIDLVTGFDRDLSHFPGMIDITPESTSWATLAFTSGAMASNAKDLGIFFENLISGKLLSPAIMGAMTTFIEAPNPGFQAQNGYGLGLMRLEVDGHEFLGHVGWFMGSSAIAMASPDQNITIAITCNLSTPDLVTVMADLLAIIKE